MLKSVDNDVRRDKNGVKFNKNCYLTFAAIDAEDGNKITAQSTFSYFNIDKPAFATKNFIHQFNQLIEVAKAVIPKDNFNKAIGKIQKVLIDDVSLFKEIKAEKVPTAKETKAINELQIKVVDAFVDAITPYTGENGDLVNMVVVTDPKGCS
jgi:nitrous oxide reductase